jgi:DNA-binding MarR family transcriptional regulator
MGEVQRYCRYDRKGLIFAQGFYTQAGEELGSLAPVARAQLANGDKGDLLITMLARAFTRMNAVIESAREAAGVSLIEGRMLRAIETSAGSTLEDLAPELLMGANASRQTLKDLEARGLVSIDRDGRIILAPAGRERLKAILDFAAGRERAALGEVSIEDVAATRRVLAHLAAWPSQG